MGVISVLLLSPCSDPERALGKPGDLLRRGEDWELVDGFLCHFGETTKVVQRSKSVKLRSAELSKGRQATCTDPLTALRLITAQVFFYKSVLAASRP